MSGVGTVATVVAAVVAFGMYLFFCWKVYNRSGDVRALSEAAKIGRLRMFMFGLPALPAEPRAERPPATGAPPAVQPAPTGKSTDGVERQPDPPTAG